MERQSGVLMHISSLPNGFSTGGFGQECKDFVDLLVKGGFTLWQVLPFCLPDDFHSPYSSFSAFSGNPYFISLTELRRMDLLTNAELAGAAEHVPYTCEFDRLAKERFSLLRRAALRVRDRAPVENYLKEHPETEAFCRFMALREANGKKPWNEWTTKDYDPELYFAWGFTQYEFDREWREIKAYANEHGIRIVGDIPIYVAYDSADVMGHPELFELDESGRPTSLAGCPPDYFSADGQFWGNPLYNWTRMKEDGFAWWEARLRHMFDWFDCVRLDHFRGFSSYWSIPAGAETAAEGKWRKGPGRAFVDMLRRVADGRAVIAEDLGEATPDVPKLLAYSGLPGMRVFQFGFSGDPLSRDMPCFYVPNCVAYSGTHDNNTLLGYIWELDGSERERMMAYLGCEGRPWDEAVRFAQRELYASVADTVIFPMQDLLGFGADTRMNRPGEPDGNWAFRFTAQQLQSLDTDRFARMAWLFGRRPAAVPTEAAETASTQAETAKAATAPAAETAAKD